MHEDDDAFRLRPGKIRSRTGGKPKTFISEVLRAMDKAVGNSLGRCRWKGARAGTINLWKRPQCLWPLSGSERGAARHH